MLLSQSLTSRLNSGSPNSTATAHTHVLDKTALSVPLDLAQKDAGLCIDVTASGSRQDVEKVNTAGVFLR